MIFANCGLPYFIGGEIKDKRMLTLQTPQSFKARFNIDVRVRNEAVAIKPNQHIVSVHNLDNNAEYDLSYDKLILSPGADPIKPPIEGRYCITIRRRHSASVWMLMTN